MPDDGRHVFVFRETERFHAVVPMAGREQILGVVRHGKQVTVHFYGRMVRRRSTGIRVWIFFAPVTSKLR